MIDFIDALAEGPDVLQDKDQRKKSLQGGGTAEPETQGTPHGLNASEAGGSAGAGAGAGAGASCGDGPATTRGPSVGGEGRAQTEGADSEGNEDYEEMGSSDCWSDDGSNGEEGGDSEEEDGES